MRPPLKPTRVAEEGLEAVEAQIEAANRLRDEIRRCGEELIAAGAAKDKHGNLIWTEAMSQYVGMQGMVTLLYLAQRGDREAAKVLFEKAVGAPEQPYSVKIGNLTEREGFVQMVAIMMQKGLQRETAEQFATALIEAEDPKALLAEVESPEP